MTLTNAQNATEADRAFAGFRRVSHDEFYKTVGHLNVHPSPKTAWSNLSGYLSEWKMLDFTGEVIGFSDSYNNGLPAGCIPGEGRYWVKESRFQAKA